MQGFKALEVKYSENSITSHILFVKPHSVREKVPEKPPGKTLFAVGVPSYCTEECLRRLFSDFGNVTAVFLHETPSAQAPPVKKSKYFPQSEPIKGFKIAYIVFNKESAVDKVLKCKKPLVLSDELVVTGVQKWFTEYNNQFINKKKLELEIKFFMDKFDEKTYKKIQEEKNLSSMQEDGWVIVTKRGRNPGFARKESVTKKLKKRGEKQHKKKALTNFFTFQIKESKRKHLVALRQKFEEDKRKIAILKEARRFKPF